MFIYNNPNNIYFYPIEVLPEDEKELKYPLF